MSDLPPLPDLDKIFFEEDEDHNLIKYTYLEDGKRIIWPAQTPDSLIRALEKHALLGRAYVIVVGGKAIAGKLDANPVAGRPNDLVLQLNLIEPDDEDTVDIDFANVERIHGPSRQSTTGIYLFAIWEK